MLSSMHSAASNPKFPSGQPSRLGRRPSAVLNGSYALDASAASLPVHGPQLRQRNHPKAHRDDVVHNKVRLPGLTAERGA